MIKLKSLFSLVFITLITAGLVTGLTACSDDSDKDETQAGDHVWKHQTDTLKTTKNAAKQLQDSLNQQQKHMDENN